jgi:hypothetical protein
MHSLQQAFRCKLSQITPDGVFGQIEFMTQVFGYHLPVSAQKVQDFLFALTGEHRNTIARGKHLHDIARYCTNYREWFMMANRSKVMTESKPLIILIAGPYRSGTNDDRTLIAKNLDRLESFALPIYQAGHIPMIGEWVALPIMKQAGSASLADPIAEQYLYPVASRLIDRCDAVFRIEGASKGADEDVRLAHKRGLPVYGRVEEIPVRSEASVTA